MDISIGFRYGSTKEVVPIEYEYDLGRFYKFVRLVYCLDWEVPDYFALRRVGHLTYSWLLAGYFLPVFSACDCVEHA